MNNNIVLVGFSLGAVFIAKYLSERKVSKNILGVFLVAPPFGNFDSIEELCGGFEMGDDLSLIDMSCNNIHMFFSVDDVIVPISHMNEFEKRLDNVNFHLLKNRHGHFILEEFPELIGEILKI